MLNQNFLDEISQTLKIKGKKILKASCVVQLFPEDGALMQQMSVRSNLSVGAILEPDKDDYRNVWLLIPVTSSSGSSAKPVADLSIIQQYLEEFIICCKACFKAYEKRSSAYTLFNCASANSYISNNFYQAYMELQTQWSVECRGVSPDYRECVVDVLESYSIPVKEKVIGDCIPYYSKGLEYQTQPPITKPILKQEEPSSFWGCLGVIWVLFGVFWSVLFGSMLGYFLSGGVTGGRLGGLLGFGVWLLSSWFIMRKP
jgi:hypothetical protein